LAGRVRQPREFYPQCGVAGNDPIADAELVFPLALDLPTIEESAPLAVEVLDPVEAALFPDATVLPGDLLVGKQVEDGFRLFAGSSEHDVRFPSFPGFLGIAIAGYDFHAFIDKAPATGAAYYEPGSQTPRFNGRVREIEPFDQLIRGMYKHGNIAE
jgi:hypothetical protein